MNYTAKKSYCRRAVELTRKYIFLSLCKEVDGDIAAAIRLQVGGDLSFCSTLLQWAAWASAVSSSRSCRTLSWTETPSAWGRSWERVSAGSGELGMDVWGRGCHCYLHHPPAPGPGDMGEIVGQDDQVPGPLGSCPPSATDETQASLPRRLLGTRCPSWGISDLQGHSGVL